MRRSVLVTFSVAITLVFGAGSAAAAAPFRLPLDPVHDVQAAGVICPFAVSVDSVKINETLLPIDTKDPDIDKWKAVGGVLVRLSLLCHEIGRAHV